MDFSVLLFFLSLNRFLTFPSYSRAQALQQPPLSPFRDPCLGVWQETVFPFLHFFWIGSLGLLLKPPRSVRILLFRPMSTWFILVRPLYDFTVRGSGVKIGSPTEDDQY